VSGQVVVVGSVNEDLVVRVERLPKPGETVSGGTFSRHHGGKGANQAVAAARFGASVRFVGAVGDDEMGAAARSALEAEGVDVSGLRVSRHSSTGVALITVDAHGENQIAVSPGANALLDAAAVRESLEGLLRPPGVLLVNLEISDEALLAAAASAHAAGFLVMVNPAPARRLPDALLDLRPMLVLNQGEAVRLADSGSVESAARSLARRTSAPVIVTHGPEGALMVDGALMTRFPGHQVEAVDTTGAGDTACGVLASEIAAGRSIDQAVRTAMAAAALSVMVAGAREGMPARADVDVFLAARG
jgi:ribokinase